MINATDAELRQQIFELQNRLAVFAADQERDAALAQEAARRLNLFEAMLEIIPVGVVISDNLGRIVLGNRAVEELVRHPVLHSESVDHYQEWISFHEDGTRVESHEYPLAKVITDNEERSELDVHYQRGDGTRFWMRIVGQRVMDNTGTRVGAAVALIDIDRERHLANQQTVLIGELNHRVKNAFSVVQSIVSQSLRKEDLPEGLREKIDHRLHAYADAHNKLVGSSWDHAGLHEMANDIVVNIAGTSVIIDGPPVSLASRQALAVSMAFYELSTNAVKHGSLSVPGGKVELSWKVFVKEDSRELLVKWVERNGPTVVEPSTKGFGSFIIDRALAMETSGTVKMDYEEDGFEWYLKMPLQTYGETNDR